MGFLDFGFGPGWGRVLGTNSQGFDNTMMCKHLRQSKPQSSGKDRALKATSVSGWIWSYLSMAMPTTINEPMVGGTILLDSQSKTLSGYTCVTFSSHVHLNF